VRTLGAKVFRDESTRNHCIPNHIQSEITTQTDESLKIDPITPTQGKTPSEFLILVADKNAI